MSLETSQIPWHSFGALALACAFHVSLSALLKGESRGFLRSKEGAQTTRRGASTVTRRGPLVITWTGYTMAPWHHQAHQWAWGPLSLANLFLKCSTGTKCLCFISSLSSSSACPRPLLLFLVSVPMQLTSGSPSYPGQTDSSHCWLCYREGEEGGQSRETRGWLKSGWRLSDKEGTSYGLDSLWSPELGSGKPLGMGNRAICQSQGLSGSLA